MGRSVKETLLRVIILLIGLAIAHLGVTLFLLANLGADPFNVFIQGIFRSIDHVLDSSLLTHGRTHMVICFLIILILFVIDKTYINNIRICSIKDNGMLFDFEKLRILNTFANTESINKYYKQHKRLNQRK